MSYFRFLNAVLVVNCCIGQVGGEAVAATQVVVKLDIAFNAEDFGSGRPSETFRAEVPDDATKTAIQEIVHRTVAMLPLEFIPEDIIVYLEGEARIKFSDGTEEFVPLSLITSMQQPLENSIRLGTFETHGNAYKLQSMLAHEVGHLLVEWASRQSGTTPSDQEFFTNWSKSIYEGVADFIAASVMNSTIIGSEDIWFHRDLLRYTSLDAARTENMSLEMAQNGLRQVGLVPTYRVYNGWFSWLEGIFQGPEVEDPYAVGLWIARKLWETSEQTCHRTAVVAAVIRLAAVNATFSDPQLFVDRILDDCQKQ